MIAQLRKLQAAFLRLLGYKVLVIERSKWLRGGNNDGNQYTTLLTEDGRMCCLGFDALACGVKSELILNKTDPSSVVQLHRSEVPTDYAATRTSPSNLMPGLILDSIAANSAIDANDDNMISEQVRERRVAAALRELGWDRVIFA